MVKTGCYGRFCTRFLLTFDVYIKYVSEASYGNTKSFGSDEAPSSQPRTFRKGIIVRKASRSANRYCGIGSKRLMLLASVTSASFISASAFAGGGGPSLTQTAQQVYVDDFTTAGALSANYAVDGTDGYALTQSMIVGSASSSQIKLSADGSSLVFGGYNAPVGTGSEYTTPYLTRSVGIMSGNGVIDTTTQWQGSTGTPVPNALWLGGANPILAAAGKYTVTPYTQIASTPTTNYTFPNASFPTLPGSPVVGNYFGGNYYATSSTTNYFGVNEINQTTFAITHLPGFPTGSALGTSSASDFTMADPDATNPYGFDTIYVANTSLGLQKWTWNSGTSSYSNVWTLGSTSGTMAFAADPNSTFLKSLVMTTDGLGDNILYGIAVDSVVKGSGTATYDDTYLLKLTDPDSSTTVGADSFTDLSASTAGEEFGGVAFAPSGTAFGAGDLAVLQIGSSAVPEPTSLGLLGLAAASLLGRRRKVQA
jgi:hypothetical protein